MADRKCENLVLQASIRRGKLARKETKDLSASKGEHGSGRGPEDMAGVGRHLTQAAANNFCHVSVAECRFVSLGLRKD